jgi:hypothetical protein
MSVEIHHKNTTDKKHRRKRAFCVFCKFMNFEENVSISRSLIYDLESLAPNLGLAGQEFYPNEARGTVCCLTAEFADLNCSLRLLGNRDGIDSLRRSLIAKQ